MPVVADIPPGLFALRSMATHGDFYECQYAHAATNAVQ